MLRQYRVGDIVICNTSYTKADGLRGFIEEVVDEPTEYRQGLYSVYGLEKPNHGEAHDVYFGDYRTSELEYTGETMGVAELEEYAKKYSDNAMIQTDMDKIISQKIGLVNN
tara:strand:- start:108 stop:440 length:333 start_codon:yes stop_codon:yes gene_type:complete